MPLELATRQPTPEEITAFCQSEEESHLPLFIDLAPYLTGKHEQERPTIANVLPDGRCLFYKGRLNEIHGEPSAGKTNVAIAACNAVLAQGGRVLYLDPEDNPQGFASRARGLGGDVGAIAARCHYMHNPTPDQITAAQEWAQDAKPDLVVLDGFAEALASEGLDENTPMDVLKYFGERLRPFADNGAAVLVADHVTKSTEGRGRWSRGSGAKLGRYDGLVLEVDLGQPYTPTEPGFVRLRIAKDRNGGAGAIGAVLAELHFSPGRGHTVVEFREPAPVGSFRPTELMEKVKAHLAAHGEDTKRGVCEAIDSKRASVMQAITKLIEEGEITSTPKGQKHILALAAGPTVSRFPTVSQPFPRNGQGEVSDRFPVSHPLGGTVTGTDATEKTTSRKAQPFPAPSTAKRLAAPIESAARFTEPDSLISAALETFKASPN